MTDCLKLARSEKAAPTLLELPANLHNRVAKEISDAESSLSSLSEIEREMTKEVILSTKSAMERLTATRIRKVIKAAVSDAYRSEPKHASDNMLPNERNLYNCIIQGISDIRA